MKKSVHLQCRQRDAFRCRMFGADAVARSREKEQLRAQIRQREIGMNINI